MTPRSLKDLINFGGTSILPLSRESLKVNPPQSAVNPPEIADTPATRESNRWSAVQLDDISMTEPPAAEIEESIEEGEVLS